MVRLELTDEDLTDIAEALDDPTTSEKNKTITNHLKEYSKAGLGGTLENKYYRPSRSLEPFLECLKRSFRAAPPTDAKQAVARIE